MSTIARVQIPGNPWQGAINRRDRAAVTGSGKPYNRKLTGYKAYQDLVAHCAARGRQGCTKGRCEVWITLGVPDRRRRDVDGPIKAILDGLTQGGVWADDSQVWALHVRKQLGLEGTRVVVRRIDEPRGAC